MNYHEISSDPWGYERGSNPPLLTLHWSTGATEGKSSHKIIPPTIKWFAYRLSWWSNYRKIQPVHTIPSLLTLFVNGCFNEKISTHLIIQSDHNCDWERVKSAFISQLTLVKRRLFYLVLVKKNVYNVCFIWTSSHIKRNLEITSAHFVICAKMNWVSTLMQHYPCVCLCNDITFQQSHAQCHQVLEIF